MTCVFNRIEFFYQTALRTSAGAPKWKSVKRRPAANRSGMKKSGAVKN
jgi:hypothetical protein